jgi:heme/copper-type cytochrome/quinol oxidase subunit 3
LLERNGDSTGSSLEVFWIVRELDKKYEVLLIIFSLVFLIFIVSEGLLFVSFFWTSFHSLSSPTLGSWPGEGFYLPDPCELTFANTLLLSNAFLFRWFSVTGTHHLLG